MSAPTAVVGDGTTTRSRVTGRWRRWRLPLAIVGLLVLVGLLAALPTPRTSTDPFAPDNPAPSGARAAAQILQRQGVEIRYVTRLGDAVAQARAGTTLLVVNGDLLLDQAAVDAVVGTEADLVVVDSPWLLEAATDAVSGDAGYWPDGDLRAECDDADATAAGTITAAPGLQALSDDAVVCFPAADDPTVGAYAVVDGERRVTALSDGRILTNELLAEEGNAALVLRALGRHERLVWYLPSAFETMTEASGPGTSDILPPWVPVLGLQLLLVVLVAAVWRGRRLGRVVPEPLPVVVPAAETTRGRGRLYRRSRSYGHAAAALRAGSAARSAARLGLPRSAEPHALVDAVARATGRPAATVEALLYGPPPHDDTGLARLAQALDHLESEVHRP